MLVELRIGGLITVNGHEIALGQTFGLLDAVARQRSVQAAAERLGVSYRSAWGRLLSLERAIGQPLVEKTKGHGSVLTAFGEQLRQALEVPLTNLERPLAAEQRDLERRLTELLEEKPTRLRIAASHDPLLVDTLAGRDIDLMVTGSEQAIERLIAGTVEVAGCHFGPGHAGDAAMLPPALRNGAFVAHPAFVRDQGLIVAARNPLRIRSVADLVRRRARFVNRQKGSGTRAWFDRLLEEAKIRTGDIRGYGVEEFTHQAVAAVIASGAADAGLGVKAVAVAFRLGFVPLGRETYFLATRVDLYSALVGEIMTELHTRAKKAVGYGPASGPQARAANGGEPGFV
jgi:molybdate transport repressor ModE-like protein